MLSTTTAERLQKVLAAHGLASRREAEDWIRAGRVQVNGAVVTELGLRVEEGKDMIQVDGKPLTVRERHQYFLLYKPRGFVTTRKDPEGRPTVIDLVKDIPTRIYPVGRLDQDTEGLLLLTNDGELAYRLTHPKYGVEKTYHARMRGNVPDPVIKAFAEGVMLEDGLTAPAKVKVLEREGGATRIELTIHEGRNRQVRRMGDAVGYPVVHLTRVSFGPLTISGLKPGAYRPLKPQEVRALQAAAGITKGNKKQADIKGKEAIKAPGKTGEKNKLAKPAGPGKGLTSVPGRKTDGGFGSDKTGFGKRPHSGVHRQRKG
ncbi:rRNA pseudouridine synthase [Heliobacterium chlorum]|uniref:Pseudouridine synthase n=1 Tax=Heliobacterium chlorum TaxID=2698 RepID=A0ABR7SYK8_HELCL|nr:rRNA pseudouridine synthase [Heliobacterium chlorum]